MFNSYSRVKGNTQAKAKGLFALSLIVPEILLVLAWSSGFVGVRYSADYAPVLTVIFWRCAVVVVLLLPWGAREILRIQPAVLFTQAGIGLLAMFGYLACVAKGIEYGVPAGLAALMADLLPLGTALLSSLFLGQRLVAKTWCGLMLGVAGVLIVTSGALSWGKAPLWTYGLPLLGMISLALATLLQKTLKAASSVSLPGTLWLQCVVSLPFFGGLSAIKGELLPVISTGFAISVAWTALFSTLAGYGLYWFCLKRTSAVRVASVLYLSPAVTLLWSKAAFNEPLSWTMLTGALLSGYGLWLVVKAEG